MHLTSVLLSYNVKFLPRKFPKGNIWRGKYRIVRKVTHKDLRNVQYHLEIEEKNMFYLRNPYLSKEQYKGAEREYIRPYQNAVADQLKERMEKFSKTTEDRKIDSYVPRVLMTSDAWE